MRTPALHGSFSAPLSADIWREREARIGRSIPLHPNLLSALKLLLALPIVASLSLSRADDAPQWSLFVLFVLFAALDYLDGLVARSHGLESWLGRVLDRVTDFPVLLALSQLAVRELPVLPLTLKLSCDALLLVLYARGFGSTHNRLRTTASYVSLFALLMLSEGVAPELVTLDLVAKLLWLNAFISLAIVLRRLGVLRRKRLADALSLANLACGVLSIGFAASGQLFACLLLLALGAAFDGCDGAAARAFGGSRLGVYMDDLADGVSYGIAPGYALYATLGGRAGALVGAAFACFVVTRLVFFTLSKAQSDPRVFRGVPSTVGGLVALSSLVLFHDEPLAVGFFAGIACASMVAFDVQYRHLGRALASRRVRFGAIVYVAALALGAALSGVQLAVGLVLASSLAYGFLPSALAFVRLRGARGARTAARPADDALGGR